MVIYRLYTNTLVTYECIGATYDDRRVINMNFCLFISFLHVRRSCLAHTRERAQVPHARVPHTWILNIRILRAHLSILLLSYTVATQVQFHFRSAKIFRTLFSAPALRRFNSLVTFLLRCNSHKKLSVYIFID